jgi:hypothetical protein
VGVVLISVAVQVLVASLHEAGGRGTYSEPARLEPSNSPPTSSVSQPTGSDETDDVALEGTAWLLALIGSLTFMLLLIASAMFYYRYRISAEIKYTSFFINSF